MSATAHKGKVFCIGLSKTATTAVSAALGHLGYRVKHYPLDCFTLDSNKRVRLKPENVAKYDGISDTVAARFFRELDRLFPGSLFILTTRDMESWLESCRKAFWYGQLFKQRDKPNQLHYELYGAIDFDRESFAKGFRHHHKLVHEYFSNRDDLLVMDVTKGDGWETLCSFMGVPVPSITFPKKDCFWAGVFKRVRLQALRDTWPFHFNRKPTWGQVRPKTA